MDSKQAIAWLGSERKLITRRAYNSDGLVEYMGFAVPGTANDATGWHIQKHTYVNRRSTETNFADGNFAFDNVWDDKEGYDYS